MYRLTRHAAKRIRKRRFAVQELAAALDGVCVAGPGGVLLYGDPATRCVLVADPRQGVIITAVRYSPAQFKFFFSKPRKAQRWLNRGKAQYRT